MNSEFQNCLRQHSMNISSRSIEIPKHPLKSHENPFKVPSKAPSKIPYTYNKHAWNTQTNMWLFLVCYLKQIDFITHSHQRMPRRQQSRSLLRSPNVGKADWICCILGIHQGIGKFLPFFNRMMLSFGYSTSC